MKAVIALLLASSSVSAIKLRNRNYQQVEKVDDFGMTPTGSIYTST